MSQLNIIFYFEEPSHIAQKKIFKITSRMVYTFSTKMCFSSIQRKLKNL